MIKLLLITVSIHLLIFTSVNGKLTILYQFALPDDLNSLTISLLENDFELSEETKGSKTFRKGETEVVTSRLGSNPYQASYLATANLIDARPRLVITTGPCGALSEETAIGSVFIIDEVVSHDMATLTNQGLSQPNHRLTVTPLPSIGILSLEGSPLEAITVASGSAFVAGDDARSQVARRTGASVVDMNSYASLYVFEKYSLHSVNLRIVSDHAGEDAAEQFARFVEGYDGILGRIAAGVILENPLSPSNVSPYPALQSLIENNSQ
ncbi:MAG: hypothetical protein AAGJ81_14645 [Verrucomicrobiota bacterium]